MVAHPPTDEPDLSSGLAALEDYEPSAWGGRPVTMVFEGLRVVHREGAIAVPAAAVLVPRGARLLERTDVRVSEMCANRHGSADRSRTWPCRQHRVPANGGCVIPARRGPVWHGVERAQAAPGVGGEPPCHRRRRGCCARSVQ